MSLITTAVMCPFCGKCFGDARDEAGHILIAHKHLDVRIGEVIRRFTVHDFSAPSDPEAIRCVCCDKAMFAFNAKSFIKHLIDAGGMARHLEAVGWQILLDRVAGDGYDTPKRNDYPPTTFNCRCTP